MTHQFDELVVDDRDAGVFRVNRSAFTDEAVLAAERALIFDRSWLYAAHESEIAQSGAFVTRDVGGRPLIITRDAQSAIRAFINSCSHRGNTVCRERSGTARSFTCFYHGWTFGLDGGLKTLPGDDTYGPGFDKDKMGLTPVPRVESYRGLIFISYQADIVDLPTYLSGARDRIDAMLDFGGDEVEIVAGQQRYSMKANWKLLAENSIDSYHAVYTHQRYFRQFIPDLGIENSDWVGDRNWGRARGLSLGDGHAATEKPTMPTPLSVAAREELSEIRDNLNAKFGEERASWIADYDRNLFIFPNLILISYWRTIRTFYPVSPGYMEVDAWAMLPKGESADLRQKRMENFISFLGPAGFGTPDDVSALEGCQRAYVAQTEAPWNDISRGMMSDAPKSTDELQMRVFWRRWHELITGKDKRDDYSDGQGNGGAVDLDAGPVRAGEAVAR